MKGSWIQNSLIHIRTVHRLYALMILMTSESKTVSILVALMLQTAIVYFHYLLKFFLSLVWICGIMLGRNTNLSLVRQNVLVPQLPQAARFIFLVVCKWHQLVLTQKNSPVGSTTVALQSSCRWAGATFATGCHTGASTCPPCPPAVHPQPQRTFLSLSGTSFTVLHVHLIHQRGKFGKIAGEDWHGNTWPVLFWGESLQWMGDNNSWGSNAFHGHKGFPTEWVS